jgi:hypothetical protein
MAGLPTQPGVRDSDSRSVGRGVVNVNVKVLPLTDDCHFRNPNED